MNDTTTYTGNTRRTVGRVPTDGDLWKVAAEQPANKTAALHLLRAAGCRRTDDDVAGVMRRAVEVVRLRKTRGDRRIVARLGHLPKASTPSNAAARARPVVLPVGTPAQRLLQLRTAAVTAAARRVLRHGAAGGHSMRVELTTTPPEVGYTVEMHGNRDTYRGSFKGWWACEDHHLIVVPRDWRTRVQRRGLATAGGMLTLDAHRLDTGGQAQLYAATWARQGRGYAVIVERGHIATQEGECFHGDSAEAALRGLRRKLAGARSVPDEAVSVERFVKRHARYGALQVTLDDARDIGACDYGIRAWCEAVGLSYAAGAATVREVLDGYVRRPQVEVRRAVLKAVRRAREDSED